MTDKALAENYLEKLAARVALLEVVDAMRDYIVPDGISAEAFASRVIAAMDNPEINPVIRELEHGRS